LSKTLKSLDILEQQSENTEKILKQWLNVYIENKTSEENLKRILNTDGLKLLREDLFKLKQSKRSGASPRIMIIDHEGQVHD
jgi:hypothetical protein